MRVYPCIRIEGGLLGPEILDRAMEGQLSGQRPQDFGLAEEARLVNEISYRFGEARRLWEAFQAWHERASRGQGFSDVTGTRERWVIPLFELLGYSLEFNRTACEADGQSYPISHRAGAEPDSPPVHIAGYGQDLGMVAPSGRPRLSPHSLVQEYLNRSESLWGVVTNGRAVRLLRDNASVRRQAYVEFDLDRMMEEENFADFQAMFRLLHRSRLPAAPADSAGCLLEQYYQTSIEEGGRVRDRLRDGVERCLLELANGFLGHPANGPLLDDVRAGAFTAEEMYRELLRLVYRLLFLLVSEERGLISADALYLEHYGVSRLRAACERRSAHTDDCDIWLSLCALRGVFASPDLAEALRVAPLNGELFEELRLDSCRIANRCLLQAFWHLAFFEDEQSRSLRRVNYQALDVEELGSVYESLLELRPVFRLEENPPRFKFAYGQERKSTGSYYTPPELVAELVRSALEPVIRERLKPCRTPEEKEKALLSLRVCDPASGSGHFLLAAARRIGRELASVRCGEQEPPPEEMRRAVRDVVARCLYAVDLNPLAVELCKVALWLESQCEDMPLSFLDHRIRCGNSVVGVFDLDVLREGVPDGAFEPRTGDSREFARLLKKRNRSETPDQLDLGLSGDSVGLPEEAIRARRQLEAVPDDSPENVRRKREEFERAQRDADLQRLRLACDLWTAAFFQPLSGQSSGAGQGEAITSSVVWNALRGRALSPQLAGTASELAAENRFFHWPLEFPEVFAAGGFDVMLGNPPWERVKLQEEEFFATRDPDVAGALNAAERKRRIQLLKEKRPELWQEYRRALRTAESTSLFLRAGGRFPLAGRGDVNLYAVFAELFAEGVRREGRAGFVVPTGIATDDSTKAFFGDLADAGRLASLFDFENREGLFPAIDSRMRFSLMTVTGGAATGAMDFAFYLTRAAQLRDGLRRYSLTRGDFRLLNPNTRTCPLFRTRADAELARSVYGRVPVLVLEGNGRDADPWEVRFLTMFHMANDSGLFRTRKELERDGWRLEGSVFRKGSSRCLPLYEAKMLHQFHHRFGTYEGVKSRSSTHLPTPDAARLADPGYCVLPWYWVEEGEVEAKLEKRDRRGSPVWSRDRGWLLGWRGITNATNERTVIAALLPRTAVGHTALLLLPGAEGAVLTACLLAVLNSLPLDYAARQKVGGTSLTYFYLKQLPVLPPWAFGREAVLFIVPRVLELVYTAHDIRAFAEDVWQEADPALRAELERFWRENRREAGGASAAPAPAQDGCPLPPFVWLEDRRARIRAELDAYLAAMYGLGRKQLRYILDPRGLSEAELRDILDPWEDPTCSGPHLLPDAPAEEFPGETFRVLKEREEREHGEYRTRRLVLEAWQRLSAEGLLPEPYDMRQDPRYQALLREAGASQPQAQARPAPRPSARVSAPDPPARPPAPAHRQPSGTPPAQGPCGVGARVLVSGRFRGVVRAVEPAAQPCLGLDGSVPRLRYTVALEGTGELKKFVAPPADIRPLDADA